MRRRPADLLARLATDDLRVIGQLRDASNAALYCELGDGGGACIYKPSAGERPLHDFAAGSLAGRERAAFVLSEAAGWGFVPPTVLRDGPFGPGVVQQWVEPDASADVIAMVLAPDPRLRPISLFDVLANNADRKGSHLLPLADGRVMAIDHGVCFAAEPKLRTVLWGWRGEPLTDAELAIVARIRAALGGSLADELAEALSRDEILALAGRADALLAERAFPLPDPRRPALPWPPF
ncbi:MAG TPA: SCO1664 family protein [Candidatus Limnocylindria bacterium]|nr:SCO1664 family protein [Candidatus Limnocylindria bacterium]